MPDLTPILEWLKSQGNIGALVVLLLPILSVILARRYGPSAPVAPTPAPDSPLLNSLAPMLLKLLESLGLLPKERPATVFDLSHETHLQIQAELDKVAAAKASTNAKQNDDFVKLGLVDVPPKA